MRFMKEKKKIRLGKNAQRVLLYALPLMIFTALSLTVYVARLDAADFLNQRENILLALETVSRLILCLALGTVLTDYAEKRSERSR